MTTRQRLLREPIHIHQSEGPTPFVAVFDSYDGAPDSSPADRLAGWGDSKFAAVVNLLGELEDLDG